MTIPARTETVKEALPGLGRGQTWGVRGVGQSIWDVSVTPKHRLGDRLVLGCRSFYYSLASEDLTAGKLNSFNPDTDAEDTVTVAHGIGTTALTITAASAITVDQYAEGLLAVIDGGVCDGDQYIIKGNDAIASGTGEVRIYEPGLVTAWTTSVNIAMYTNVFYNIQESNTAQTESPAGIALRDVDQSAAPYFWLQTYGPAAVLMDEICGNGTTAMMLVIGTGADGSIEKADGYGEVQAGFIPQSAVATEDAHYQMVFLTCVR